MNYILHILVLLEIYILLAMSLNIKTGFTGLLSLAQAVFYGVSAYCIALLTTKFQLNFYLSLGAAILINIFLTTSIIAFFASKLRNLYFTLATLAFQMVFYGIAYNWIGVTNGPYGISGIPKPQLFGLEFNTTVLFAGFSTFFVVLSLLMFYWFTKLPIVRMFECTREDEVLLTTLGKRPNYYKFLSIAFASVFASIAGALYATYMSYIDATSFTIDESILVLTICLVGGTGNIKGSISGALLYILLPELLRFLKLPDNIAPNMRMILYSTILLLVVRFRPNGFFGKYIFK